jgi:hypothetical protein
LPAVAAAISAAMAALFSARGRPGLGLVESSDGIVGKERIGAADERQMMAQVLG